MGPGSSPDPRKLHVTYTLTHSDSTGDLYLTVGPTFDRQQTSGWHTRLIRDEVLAEWAAVRVRFHSTSSRFDIAEAWGWLRDHRE